MQKLTGTIRITPNPGSSAERPYFEVVFVPYHGRLNTRAVKVASPEDLLSFLIEIRIGEDEAARWAGKARSEGVVLISGIERTEAQLRENGLLA